MVGGQVNKQGGVAIPSLNLNTGGLALAQSSQQPSNIVSQQQQADMRYNEPQQNKKGKNRK
jgi:hypothetical protein